MKKWCIVLLCLSVANCYANLILNPDFELPGGNFQLGSGTITSWGTWNTSGWYQQDTGDQTVKIWNSDSGAYQDFSCTIGTIYEFGISYYSTNGSEEWLVDRAGTLKAEWYSDASGGSEYKIGETSLNLEPAAAATWYSASLMSTAPATAVIGRLVLTVTDTGSVPAGTCYFDDASVIAVPEPVSAALLAAGIGFIYLLRRRIMKD